MQADTFAIIMLGILASLTQLSNLQESGSTSDQEVNAIDQPANDLSETNEGSGNSEDLNNQESEAVTPANTNKQAEVETTTKRVETTTEKKPNFDITIPTDCVILDSQNEDGIYTTLSNNLRPYILRKLTDLQDFVRVGTNYFSHNFGNRTYLNGEIICARRGTQMAQLSHAARKDLLKFVTTRPKDESIPCFYVDLTQDSHDELLASQDGRRYFYQTQDLQEMTKQNIQQLTNEEGKKCYIYTIASKQISQIDCEEIAPIICSPRPDVGRLFAQLEDLAVSTFSSDLVSTKITSIINTLPHLDTVGCIKPQTKSIQEFFSLYLPASTEFDPIFFLKQIRRDLLQLNRLVPLLKHHYVTIPHEDGKTCICTRQTKYVQQTSFPRDSYNPSQGRISLLTLIKNLILQPQLMIAPLLVGMLTCCPVYCCITCCWLSKKSSYHNDTLESLERTSSPIEQKYQPYKLKITPKIEKRNQKIKNKVRFHSSVKENPPSSSDTSSESGLDYLKPTPVHFKEQ